MTRATGAHPLAMGNAFVGQANDGSALFLNAAGLAAAHHWLLTSTYTQPDEDTLFTAIGYARPDILDGTVGLGYRNRTINNVQTTNETFSVSDQELLLAYSREFAPGLAAGLALRLTTAGPSTTVPGYSGSHGQALDLSLKYDYLPWCQLGLALQNLGGLTVNDGGADETADAIVKLGSSFLLRGYDGLFDADKDLRLNLDLESEDDLPFAWHLGFEWWVLDQLAVRAGIDQVAKSSTENYNNLTAGLSLKVNGIIFDYAWYRSGDIAQDTTNYFSFGYIGPEPPKKERPVKTIKAFPSPEPKPAVATQLQRVRFSDLPPEHWVKDMAEKLATAGLLTGYPDGTYRPDIKMTRSHFASVWLAARNIQSTDQAATVGGDIWAASPNTYVSRLEAADLMGVDGNISRPDDPVTRAEFAVLLAKTQIGQAALNRLPPLNN
ncbi:MAG: S-layer homology domain-containing protein [Candidatus Saganbacteria bacterium]|nr:S-layer homology domain-containing protein [Candidatus Saganbacteria bacterium]